ncbi:hypothetical protein EV200_1016 [Pedobacter psychrotolerans]|nr:hypothetical protein EV200_1016 [Pedobacter psychrotolerans]
MDYFGYIRHIYQVLEKKYPNEYIYKNNFLNDWILKKFALENSVVFNEFRVVDSIADLVIFNGCSKVFEIKTILDGEYRLSKQLESYKKIFNEIYIIVPLSQIERYLKFEEKIGVITYDHLSNCFTVVQESTKNLEIDPCTAMNILRTKEYKSIVSQYYGETPEMNDFNQYEVCKKLIEQIPPISFNKMFVDLMKVRKINNNFQKEYKELNQICLAMNLSLKEQDLLYKNLKNLINY